MKKEKIIIEIMASVEHERWSGWMKYMVKRMKQRKDGTLEFDDNDFGRWMQQAITPYSRLSEEEKESDRTEARATLKALEEEGFEII